VLGRKHGGFFAECSSHSARSIPSANPLAYSFPKRDAVLRKRLMPGPFGSRLFSSLMPCASEQAQPIGLRRWHGGQVAGARG
jgi:hypothetical protein